MLFCRITNESIDPAMNIVTGALYFD